jgi:hypothetical protein
MTDATDGNAPPDEEKRRIIEDAILAFRPDVARQFPREPPPPGPVFGGLATATNIPRLVKHRSLIDGMRRSTADVRAVLDDQARNVLASTLEPDLPEDRRQSLAEQARRRLDEVAEAPGEARLRPQHWQLWIRSTNDIFRFTTHERTFEACNDERREMKATPDGQFVLSRLIIAQFWSDRPPADFVTFVDPRNWPNCSPFWREVRGLRPVVQLADGYDLDFAETVNIVTETVTVPLSIGFRILPDLSRVWTRFNISRDFYDPTTPVDVDTGIVSAESISGGPAPTRVLATKYLHWRDPGRRPDLTALACDFGWCELMEEMAYGCAQGFGPASVQATGTQTTGTQTAETQAGTEADGAKTPVDVAIRQLVKSVTTECQASISENGPRLEQLIGRFTGSSWDAGWINDLLDMGLVTVRHYGNIASGVRRFADSLRDASTEDAATESAATKGAATKGAATEDAAAERGGHG